MDENKNNEINKEDSKEISEPNNITREINLDELYDGAINNTVVIDPITNDEVLLQNKKPNYTLLGVALAIIILLLLYYVNNKTDLGKATKNVEPKTTLSTVLKTEKTVDKTGTLTCNYNSKSDAETQTISFIANYMNNTLVNSKFDYVVISNLETTTDIIEDLKEQYETFYINNASVIGNKVTFEKNEKGFTFGVETDYKNVEYDKIIIEEDKTILYVKPSNMDTYESLLNLYEQKGFSCSLSSFDGD